MAEGEVSYVLQDWLEPLSWKKQTVLLGAIRSPDNIHTLKIKQVVVWLRAVVLRDADPMTGFMHGALREGLPLFESMDREFERLPLHAAHHLILAMQIVMNEHPDPDTASQARKFYTDAVEAQHLSPEPRGQYEQRMTDNASRVEEGVS